MSLNAEDYNALRAHVKIDGHEKVCAERYSQILDKLSSLERQLVVVHGRFNTISNRMWAILCSVAGGAIVGLGGTVFYLLTKGH